MKFQFFSISALDPQPDQEALNRFFSSHSIASIEKHFVPAGADRVLRGGSWINNGRWCRSANRNRNHPGNRNNNIGLRLARAHQGRSAFLTRPLSGPSEVDDNQPRAAKTKGLPGMLVAEAERGRTLAGKPIFLGEI